MAEIKQCTGCGVELQTELPRGLGYIPNSALSKGQVICQRCFKIKHYNEVVPTQINENDFVQILNKIAYTKSLVVQIVDLLDIDSTLIAGLPRFIGDNPYIMVANKIDLFPKTINLARTKHWLRTYAHEHGLNPEEIFLASVEKGQGIEEIADYLRENSKKRDIYVVGATNVGKSSMINKLMPLLYAGKQAELTTSRFPGTTLDTIRLPLNNGRFLIDTPGVVHKERFSEMVSPNTLKVITPKKLLKPKVYQLIGEQTLFLGGLVRIDQASKSRNSFVCYISNELEIHRTKLENAESLYQKHLGELLTPPTAEEVDKLPGLVKHSFRLTAGEKSDIVISGLGWIAVDGESVSIDVFVPKGIGVHLRKALI